MPTRRWRVQTPDPLTSVKSHYREQLDFLSSSCGAFDRGRPHEAKRIATTLRVLLHDTKRSHSLLRQLGWKDELRLPDTAGEVDPANLTPTHNLLMMRIQTDTDGQTSFDWVPFLDDSPRPVRQLLFADWWDMIVVKDANGEEFSRSDLVLALANQEGGAHIDPKSRQRIQALKRCETIGFSLIVDHGDHFDELRLTKDPLLPCVRQIGHEFLRGIGRPVDSGCAAFGL